MASSWPRGQSEALSLVHAAVRALPPVRPFPLTSLRHSFPEFYVPSCLQASYMIFLLLCPVLYFFRFTLDFGSFKKPSLTPLPTHPKHKGQEAN